MSTTPTMEDWHAHYDGGRDFRPLTDTEKAVLGERLALPDDARDARALDVACGTGELARLLAGAGYRVDAVDWAEAAVERASAAPSDAIDHHRLDVTAGDLASLAPVGGAALAALRGGCLTAASVHAALDETTERLTVYAVVLDPAGGEPLRTVTTGPAAEPASVGHEAGEQLLAVGTARLLGARP
ncbi:class I SAM-dependent methyltransferase [Streptomyces sp. NPDC059761]|uniref:class I SAM-dependent methyltransferase n=1 Tax=Streptomyces sp. NPDC059761 TaxID=3346937 RepID=UPI00364A6D62